MASPRTVLLLAVTLLVILQCTQVHAWSPCFRDAACTPTNMPQKCGVNATGAGGAMECCPCPSRGITYYNGICMCQDEQPTPTPSNVILPNCDNDMVKKTPCYPAFRKCMDALNIPEPTPTPSTDGATGSTTSTPLPTATAGTSTPLPVVVTASGCPDAQSCAVILTPCITASFQPNMCSALNRCSDLLKEDARMSKCRSIERQRMCAGSFSGAIPSTTPRPTPAPTPTPAPPPKWDVAMQNKVLRTRYKRSDTNCREAIAVFGNVAVGLTYECSRPFSSSSSSSSSDWVNESGKVAIRTMKAEATTTRRDYFKLTLTDPNLFGKTRHMGYRVRTSTTYTTYDIADKDAGKWTSPSSRGTGQMTQYEVNSNPFPKYLFLGRFEYYVDLETGTSTGIDAPSTSEVGSAYMMGAMLIATPSNQQAVIGAYKRPISCGSNPALNVECILTTEVYLDAAAPESKMYLELKYTPTATSGGRLEWTLTRSSDGTRYLRFVGNSSPSDLISGNAWNTTLTASDSAANSTVDPCNYELAIRGNMGIAVAHNCENHYAYVAHATVTSQAAGPKRVLLTGKGGLKDELLVTINGDRAQIEISGQPLYSGLVWGSEAMRTAPVVATAERCAELKTRYDTCSATLNTNAASWTSAQGEYREHDTFCRSCNRGIKEYLYLCGNRFTDTSVAQIAQLDRVCARAVVPNPNIPGVAPSKEYCYGLALQAAPQCAALWRNTPVDLSRAGPNVPYDQHPWKTAPTSLQTWIADQRPAFCQNRCNRQLNAFIDCMTAADRFELAGIPAESTILPDLMCMSRGDEVCLTKFGSSLFAKDATISKDVGPTFLEAQCTDCTQGIINVLSKRRAWRDRAMQAQTMCLKDGGEFCLPKLSGLPIDFTNPDQELDSPSFLFQPAVLDILCANRCFFKLTSTSLAMSDDPSEAANALKAFEFMCVKDGSTYCIQKMMAGVMANMGSGTSSSSAGEDGSDGDIQCAFDMGTMGPGASTTPIPPSSSAVPSPSTSRTPSPAPGTPGGVAASCDLDKLATCSTDAIAGCRAPTSREQICDCAKKSFQCIKDAKCFVKAQEEACRSTFQGLTGSGITCTFNCDAPALLEIASTAMDQEVSSELTVLDVANLGSHLTSLILHHTRSLVHNSPDLHHAVSLAQSGDLDLHVLSTQGHQEEGQSSSSFVQWLQTNSRSLHLQQVPAGCDTTKLQACATSAQSCVGSTQASGDVAKQCECVKQTVTCTLGTGCMPKAQVCDQLKSNPVPCDIPECGITASAGSTPIPPQSASSTPVPTVAAGTCDASVMASCTREMSPCITAAAGDLSKTCACAQTAIACFSRASCQVPNQFCQAYNNIPGCSVSGCGGAAGAPVSTSAPATPAMPSASFTCPSETCRKAVSSVFGNLGCCGGSIMEFMSSVMGDAGSSPGGSSGAPLSPSQAEAFTYLIRGQLEACGADLSQPKCPTAQRKTYERRARLKMRWAWVQSNLGKFKEQFATDVANSLAISTDEVQVLTVRPLMIDGEAVPEEGTSTRLLQAQGGDEIEVEYQITATPVVGKSLENTDINLAETSATYEADTGSAITVTGLSGDTESEKKSGMPMWMIGAIAGGAVVVLAAIIGAVVVMKRKGKGSSSSGSLAHNQAMPPRPDAGGYGGHAQPMYNIPGQQHAPPPPAHPPSYAEATRPPPPPPQV
eukprot:TRINITY_DN5039_c0_g1_i2.p1 TRINITY_DN5039_c0_g1~~TRINITY_DN5039_c0_g1_i2.p1  ORF type:complete len:1681 (+),score=330.90 TRINITY_DN5039_c0_g1_i2:133-5175(+)